MIHFNVYLLGPLSQRQFNKNLERIGEYDELLSRKFNLAPRDLTYDIHSFYQVATPLEALYDWVRGEAEKSPDPYLIILYKRTWTRYGGALGWADCEGSTSTVYTVRWLPFWIDTHVIRHEMAHTVLCLLGREYVKAVHTDPELN